MSNVLESRLTKIAKRKEDLSQMEKMILEKKKKLQQKQDIEIGRLAGKVNLDKLDRQALLGAFIEISQRAHQPELIEKWKVDAEVYLQVSSDTSSANGTPLSISFKSEVTEEAKKLLKSLKFCWNKFRREFYGYGKKEELEILLKAFECRVEVID